MNRKREDEQVHRTAVPHMRGDEPGLDDHVVNVAALALSLPLTIALERG